MKIIKHMVKVVKYYIKRVRCKHPNSSVASCPFTGYTYITCTNCATRIGVKKTDG